MGDTVRTKIGNLCGEANRVIKATGPNSEETQRKLSQVKNGTLFYVFISGFLGLCIFFIVFFLRFHISTFYSTNLNVQECIAQVLIPYSFGTICELILGSQNTLMRLTHRARQLFWIMMTFYLLVNGCLGYL